MPLFVKVILNSMKNNTINVWMNGSINYPLNMEGNTGNEKDLHI